jgi:hypothetical protein
MTRPPFCPYRLCINHNHPPTYRWWRRDGYHRTSCFGDVPRFQCCQCGRTFSTQTFSTDYYAKRRIDYGRLEAFLSSSMSVRALARAFVCSCGSIINRTDRLARQELAAHAALRPLARRPEDVCIDGFVAFDCSQYFPNNITISITADSRFILAYTHATLRRSGHMRPDQKRKRDWIYAGLLFERHALERSFVDILDELERDRWHRPLVIITDEKHEYARAFTAHNLFRDQDNQRRVIHHTVNASLPRTIRNPLFPSNYLDREMRKDQAAHRRESTCFNRSVINGLSRLACYVGWHNYAKRFLIKARVDDQRTHAEEAGIPNSEVVGVRARMFRRRAFLSLLALDRLETRLWMKQFPTLGSSVLAYLPNFAMA